MKCKGNGTGGDCPYDSAKFSSVKKQTMSGRIFYLLDVTFLICSSPLVENAAGRALAFWSYGRFVCRNAGLEMKPGSRRQPWG